MENYRIKLYSMLLLIFTACTGRNSNLNNTDVDTTVIEEPIEEKVIKSPGETAKEFFILLSKKRFNEAYSLQRNPAWRDFTRIST